MKNVYWVRFEVHDGQTFPDYQLKRYASSYGAIKKAETMTDDELKRAIAKGIRKAMEDEE